MEFKDGDYILGIWFMSNKGGNFILSVVKRNEKWIGEYRFRYFRDNKTFGSKDKKSFYSMELHEGSTEQEIMTGIDEVIEGFGKSYQPDVVDKILIQSTDMNKLMFEMAKKDWCQVSSGKTMEEAMQRGEEKMGETIKGRR
jgi:predicted RNase H-like HicB family nuclease